MKELTGVLFTTMLVVGAFHYNSILLGVAATMMCLIMIGRFDRE